LPVDSEGLLDPAASAAALDDETVLVSVAAANNETGTLQPIVELAGVAHRAGALFHTDAAQAAGKIPLDVALAVALGAAAQLATDELASGRGAQLADLRESPPARHATASP
jgi:cysteine desulfurase